MTRPTKERIKEVMEEVEELNLADGAHWMLIHEKLGLEYGDLFPMLEDDPEYFGIEEADK